MSAHTVVESRLHTIPSALEWSKGKRVVLYVRVFVGEKLDLVELYLNELHADRRPYEVLVHYPKEYLPDQEGEGWVTREQAQYITLGEALGFFSKKLTSLEV